MSEWTSQESDFSRQCMLNVLVGKMIGSGAYRRVYEFPADPTIVIKVEHAGREFCNIHEWQVWEEVKDTPIGEWFAPCVRIDAYGLALIQRRTKGFDSEAEFKAAVAQMPGGKLPPFFEDVHYGNFGMLEGRVVCHDYGFTKFIRDGVKVGWKEEQRKAEARARSKNKKKDRKK